MPRLTLPHRIWRWAASLLWLPLSLWERRLGVRFGAYPIRYTRAMKVAQSPMEYCDATQMWFVLNPSYEAAS